MVSALLSRPHPVLPRNSGINAQLGDGYCSANKLINSSLLVTFSKFYHTSKKPLKEP